MKKLTISFLSLLMLSSLTSSAATSDFSDLTLKEREQKALEIISNYSSNDKALGLAFAAAGGIQALGGAVFALLALAGEKLDIPLAVTASSIGTLGAIECGFGVALYRDRGLDEAEKNLKEALAEREAVAA